MQIRFECTQWSEYPMWRKWPKQTESWLAMGRCGHAWQVIGWWPTSYKYPTKRSTMSRIALGMAGVCEFHSCPEMDARGGVAPTVWSSIGTSQRMVCMYFRSNVWWWVMTGLAEIEGRLNMPRVVAEFSWSGAWFRVSHLWTEVDDTEQRVW